MRESTIRRGVVLSALWLLPLGTLSAQIPLHPGEVNPGVFQGTPKRFKDGRIQRGLLSQDCTLSGHALPAGSEVDFMETGALRSCRLGRATPILGQVLPAETRLFFLAGGRLRMFWLPAPTLLQGHLVQGPQRDGQGNRLHPSGALSAIWLAKEEVIDGVPCTSEGSWFNRLGTRRMAFFYDDGRLRQAHLARDYTRDGHTFRKGDIISLSPAGSVDLRADKLE